MLQIVTVEFLVDLGGILIQTVTGVCSRPWREFVLQIMTVQFAVDLGGSLCYR